MWVLQSSRGTLPCKPPPFATYSYYPITTPTDVVIENPTGTNFYGVSVGSGSLLNLGTPSSASPIPASRGAGTPQVAGHSSCAFVAIVLCFCVLDQEICSAEWQKQEFESSVQVPVGRFWPDVSLLFLLTVVVLRRGKLPLGLRREEKRVS
jgi:hypothetical protein